MTVQKFKTDLNCQSCVAAVAPHFDNDPAIKHWSVETDDPDKVLTVEGEGVTAEKIQQHVAAAGFHVLGSLEYSHAEGDNTQKSSWTTYRPLLLILAYLIGTVALFELTADSFDWMRAMGNFMGGFFLAFSFFKMLDLSGFADAYQTYDVLATRWRSYGFFYPFLELLLGIAYLTRFQPVVTNLVTLIVMLVGLVGVSQALVQKRQIQCGCLGTMFDLPMTKITFIEDALMAAMAAAMLSGHWWM